MSDLAKYCIASGAFPSTLKNPAHALVIMQAGVELGIKPMQAIQSMFFVNGKLSMYSSALLGRMKQNGLIVKWIKLSAEEVVGEFSTKDQPAVTLKFGLEDAKRAGLGGTNYNKYPQDMYVARCVSRAAKLFPELVGAPIETMEVMQDVIEMEPAAEGVPEKLISKGEKRVRKAAEEKPLDDDHQTLLDEMQEAKTEVHADAIRAKIVGKARNVESAKQLGTAFVAMKERIAMGVMAPVKEQKATPVEEDPVAVAAEVFAEKPSKKSVLDKLFESANNPQK
jgi:hypothetical protein